MRQAKTRVRFPVYPRSLLGEVEISSIKNIVLSGRPEAAALAELGTRQGQVLFEREASCRPILQ